MNTVHLLPGKFQNTTSVGCTVMMLITSPKYDYQYPMVSYFEHLFFIIYYYFTSWCLFRDQYVSKIDESTHYRRKTVEQAVVNCYLKLKLLCLKNPKLFIIKVKELEKKNIILKAINIKNLLVHVAGDGSFVLPSMIKTQWCITNLL